MGYYDAIAYWVPGSGAGFSCERCIAKDLTEIEFQVLTGQVYSGDEIEWPVREKDGTFKLDEDGEIVYKSVRYNREKHIPRTEYGDEVQGISEYDLSDEGNGEWCDDCGCEIVAPYGVECSLCGEMAATGSDASKLERDHSPVICKDCCEAVFSSAMEMIQGRLEDWYIACIEARECTSKPGLWALIGCGKDKTWMDRGHIVEQYRNKANADYTPKDLIDELNEKVEEFYWLAMKNGKSAQAYQTYLRLQEICTQEVSQALEEAELDEDLEYITEIYETLCSF